MKKYFNVENVMFVALLVLVIMFAEAMIADAIYYYTEELLTVAVYGGIIWLVVYLVKEVTKRVLKIIKPAE